MSFLRNMKTLFFSILLSVFIIGYLVSYGMIERLSIVMILILAYFFVKNIKKDDPKYFPAVIISFILGMVLCTYTLLYFEYKSNDKKELTDMGENLNTAVVLVFDGEPERYELSILLKNMGRSNRITDQLFIPFRLYKYKRVYEDIGTSSYNDISKRISLKVSNGLENGYDVYVSYLNNPPYYKEVLNEQIIRNNYKKIIVAPIFLTESIEYKHIVNELEMENLYHSTNRLKFMAPLWDSEKMIKSIVKEVLKKEKKKNEVGIIFMSRHSRNTSSTSIDPKEINQEKIFIEKIKKELIKNGYEDRKIKSMELNFSNSEIKDIIEELQQYGVAKILLIGFNDIVDKIENQHEIQKFMKKFNSVEETDMEYVKGWGEDDLVIEELEFRIRLLNVENWDR